MSFQTEININRWTGAERRSLEEWSLVLSLISKTADWSAAEKRAMIEIIRSQSGPDEMRYLHLTPASRAAATGTTGAGIVSRSLNENTTVRLNVEENQLVNVIGEFGICLGA
jgi:hypothetical protein